MSFHILFICKMRIPQNPVIPQIPFADSAEPFCRFSKKIGSTDSFLKKDRICRILVTDLSSLLVGGIDILI